MLRHYKGYTIIGFLSVLFFINTLHAQTYKWGNVAIGGGGLVSGIVLSKTQPNLMYARTDVGGAYRWNSTTSSWISLLDWASENQKSYQGVEAIALDPSASNIVYMLIGTSYFNGGATAIIRSTDYGNTFTIIDVTSQFKAHGNGMGRQNGERLAVDPNKGSILFCGTRYNGLFKSTTSGTSWTNVTTIGNATANGNGINFVVFDPSTGTPGNATQTIVFGVSQTGSNLYISNDGGSTFNTIAGAPTTLMPQRAVLTSNRDLIITYSDAEGPWNIGSGQIWKYSLSTGTWTNLTPAGYTFGFGGISVDPNNPNRMIASSMNVYWNQYGSVYGDRFFLSTNGGTNWKDIVAGGITLDNNGIGWINGNSIHWTGCIEFNPFNTNQAHVISGNGLFTNDNVNTSTTWRFNVKGLEETVPLDVISIPNGPFVSVIGDYDGFVHTDVTQYPPNRHNPSMGSTNGVAYAGSNTNSIVRVGSSMYYTTNQGSTWTKTNSLNGSNGHVGISANGATIFHCPDTYSTTYRSTDNGNTWNTCNGLGITNAIPVGDPVNPNKVYAYDNGSGNLFISVDAGANFSAAGNAGTGGSKIIRTAPGYEGHLWVALNGGGLTRSTNSGTSFTKITNVTNCQSVGLGKAAVGSPYYSIYIWGVVGGVTGVYRSDDQGASWTRINDDNHEYGGVGNGGYVIGDFNVYGRVYLSTVGRGIPYGELITSTCSSLSSIGSIVGNTSLCVGATGTYSVPGVTSATGYVWSVPVGSSIVSGSNTNVVSLNLGSVGGIISVKAFNSCSTISSLNFSVTVNPAIVPTVTISSSATTVCSGTGVTFTATGVNGGTAPTFAWLKNNVQVSTGQTYNYTPTNGDAITAKLTVGGILPACLSTSTAISTAINLTVNPVPSASVTISSSATNVCSGTGVTITASGINGGSNPTYTWLKNNVPQGTGTTFSYSPANGDVVNAILTAGGTLPNCLIGNPATSNGINLTVNLVPSASVTITSSATTVCSGTGVTFTATGVNGGTAPTYVWLRNNVQVSIGQTYTYIPTNGDAITAKLTAGGTLPTCLSTSTAISTAINLTVNPVQTASVTISSSATTVCSGTGVTFTATGVNGGTAPTYAWMKNNVQVSTGQTYSYIPTNGDVITTKLTAGGTLPTCLSTSTAISTAINLTVNPVQTASVTISSSATTVCSGTGGTFTATGFNGGTAPTYAWLRNNVQVSTGQTYNYTPINGDAITAKLTAGGTLPTCLSTSTAISTAINLTVNPVQTASVTISSSATTVCSGTGVTFTATGINGGTAPTYAWLRNNVQVSSGQTYTYIPTNGDAITAKLTTGGTLPTCLSTSTAVSNAINLTVNPVPIASVTISSSATTVCSGTGVTFTATGVNGGTASTYAWMKNNVQVSTGQTYGYVPSNGDVITAKLTAGGTLPTCLSTTSVTSSGISLTVNPLLPVSVSIVSSVNSVCSGTGVTFTAMGVNTGSLPVYSWYVNNLIKSTGNTFTYIPSNNDLVKAIVTTSGTCITGSPAQSSSIQLTVNPLVQTSVSIQASANPVCSNTGVVFTATPINGGSTPSYQWFVNGVNQGINSNTLNYSPSNGDIVRATIAAGGSLPGCLFTTNATSSGITAIVNGTIQSALSILPSSSVLCQGNAVTFTTSASGTGTAPVYNWFVNGAVQSSNGPTFSYLPNTGDIVKATMSPGGAGTTCVLGGVASSSGVVLTVNSNLQASVAISTPNVSVCSGSSVTFTATGVNTGSAPSYTWNVNSQVQSTGSTFSYSPANGDIVKSILSIGGTGTACVIGSPATSNGVNLQVSPIKTISVSVSASATSICSGTGVTFTSIGFNGGTSPSIAWLVNGNSISSGVTFSYVPANNDVVSAIINSGGSGTQCLNSSQATSTGVSIQVIPLNQSPCQLPQITSITGSSYIVSGSTGVVFSVPAGSANAYQWSVPTGATIVSGQGTNSIVVDFGNTVNGSISLDATNSNGTTSITKQIQTGTAPNIGTITGPTLISPSQTGVVYSVNSVAGVNYQWTVPLGATITSGQGTNTVTLDFGASISGFVSVAVSNVFGTSKDSVGIQTSAITRLDVVNTNISINVFPNPYDKQAVVHIVSASQTPISLELNDLNGYGHSSWKELTSPVQIEIGEGLPSGMYALSIKQGDFRQVIKLVKIN